MPRHLIFSTCFGNAAVTFRENPFFLVNTFLPCKNQKQLFESASLYDWGEPGSDPTAIQIAESIIAYFNGKQLLIPWEVMDWGRLTVLQKSVLIATAHIPYGQVRTYKDVAQAINRPKACRFVGSTLAKNPFPILIPCHRVVRSDGSIGQFGGGTDLKQKLIDLEAGS